MDEKNSTSLFFFLQVFPFSEAMPHMSSEPVIELVGTPPKNESEKCSKTKDGAQYRYFITDIRGLEKNLYKHFIIGDQNH